MSIRPLREEDIKGGFSCGEPALDNYFTRHALPNHEAEISRCYVLESDTHAGVVIGYYTLSARSVERELLSQSMTIPSGIRYPLPAFLLGRFAVQERFKRNGFGRMLLRDAMTRCERAAADVASIGVFLESKNENSTAFYAKLGFVKLGADVSPQPMFLPMSTLRRAIQR